MHNIYTILVLFRTYDMGTSYSTYNHRQNPVASNCHLIQIYLVPKVYSHGNYLK